MRNQSLYQGFKLFVASKPPLVLVLASFCTFVAILLSLLIYLNTHDIRNPDISDWNTFKASFVPLDYCINLPSRKNYTKIREVNPLVNKEKRATHSFEISLAIQADENVQNLLSLSNIKGSIEPHQIGLKTHYTLSEVLLLSFDVINFADEKNLKKKLKSGFCNEHKSDKSCSELKMRTCLTITGPADAFPKTRFPSKCSAKKSNANDKWDTTFDAYKEAPDVPIEHFWCPATDGMRAKIIHEVDPSLFVLLTPGDKQIIGSNLKSCIWMLSVVTTVVLIYEILRHRVKLPFIYQQVAAK